MGTRLCMDIITLVLNRTGIGNGIYDTKLDLTGPPMNIIHKNQVKLPWKNNRIDCGNFYNPFKS